MADRQHIAVIGAGWAGCSAALELSRAGCRVTVLEAARSLGGRARSVELDGQLRDNGQHILLGAYSATLRALKLAGVDAATALLNVPLQMRYPPGCGGMDFIAPRLPAPLHMLVALLRASGLERADKLALARFSTTARWMEWQLNVDCSVSELLQRFDQTERLTKLMWRPLCLAALNTPPERASAKVFLNVLRDSLGAKRSASDMLLPRLDLGALFPQAVARLLEQGGNQVLLGKRVTSVQQGPDQRWQVATQDSGDSAPFDAVVLATPAAVSASLLPALPQLAATLESFTYEAISTCYLQYDPSLRLALPFYALLDDPEQDAWGQFVFDRGQLDPGQAGCLAVVVSASGQAAALGQAALCASVARQLAQVLQMEQLGNPRNAHLITEKRATFACTSGLVRPHNATALPGLALAGDYTASDYPATLEAAVRSGAQAAQLVLAARRR